MDKILRSQVHGYLLLVLIALMLVTIPLIAVSSHVGGEAGAALGWVAALILFTPVGALAVFDLRYYWLAQDRRSVDDPVIAAKFTQPREQVVLMIASLAVAAGCAAFTVATVH